MLPDYSNDAAYDAMWGGGYETPESIEAERIEEAKNGLVDYLAAQIAAYNQIHRLEVDGKALKHAVECISDVACDMYAGYVPKSISQVFLETFANAHGLKMEDFGRTITNPATLSAQGVEL